MKQCKHVPIKVWNLLIIFAMVTSRLRVRTYGGYPLQKGHALFVRDVLNTQLTFKKSLKIPKGQSESVYRRRTDNTMAKRKSTKGQTTIYKTYI